MSYRRCGLHAPPPAHPPAPLVPFPDDCPAPRRIGPASGLIVALLKMYIGCRFYRMRENLALLFAGLSGMAAISPAWAFEAIYERAPIHYHETEADTPVTWLLKDAAEKGFLSTGSDRDILRELLQRLDVPVESQVLVF